MNRQDARWEFFRPFHETRRGQIIGLATPRDHMRDGLAISLLTRHFPLPEYDGIVVEPSRPSVQPAENVILVGSSPLFVKPDAHPISGDALPLGVGDEKLGERLRNIDRSCCFRFRNGNGRTLANDVTNETWAPTGARGAGVLVDYGVIRRVFRAAFENTVIVEGVHRLGTLGAAKVVTSALCLRAIWEAVHKLPAFDESRPLEILVRATFHDEHRQGVYSLDAVNAVPLLVVYDRQWVYDLVDGQRWTDQLPWTVQLRVRGDESPQALRTAEEARERPRLEIEADLRGADPAFRRLCGELLGPEARNGLPPATAPDPELDALLELLPAEIDRFRVLAFDDTSERPTELPQGKSRIRKLRKLLLVHLALRLLRRRRFRCDEAHIRRFFPDFEGGSSSRPFVSQFIGAVPGKMREGFEPLLGEARRSKDHVRIEYRRRHSGYALRLDRASLVVRLRV